MKRIAILSLLFLFTATSTFAHAGEEHTSLGTVIRTNADGSFVIKTSNGKQQTIHISKNTKFTDPNGQVAQASDLAAGQRVSVRIAKDGKNALTVKFGPARKAKK